MTTVTTSELLARALDPTDPEAALRQEVADGGLAHLLNGLREWLREDELEPPTLEADLTELVERVVNAPAESTRPLTRAGLAQNLRRAMAGTSAVALARASGVHRNTIANICSGETSPTVDTLGSLANALTIPASSLLETTMTWTISLDSDFAVTVRGNRVSIIIDPVERTVDDWHVSIGGNSMPSTVHAGLKRMVRVPRGAIGEEVAAALTARVDLLDAIAEQYQGAYWDGSNQRGRWGEGAMSLLAELREALKGVRRYWDAEDWIDWECGQGREEAALVIARAVIDAAEWTAGLDAHLESFRREGDLDTDEAEREARDLLERVADELESELDSAREDAELDEETGERDEDAVAEVERLLGLVSTLRKALDLT